MGVCLLLFVFWLVFVSWAFNFDMRYSIIPTFLRGHSVANSVRGLFSHLVYLLEPLGFLLSYSRFVGISESSISEFERKLWRIHSCSWSSLQSVTLAMLSMKEVSAHCGWMLAIQDVFVERTFTMTRLYSSVTGKHTQFMWLLVCA